MRDRTVDSFLQAQGQGRHHTQIHFSRFRALGSAWDEGTLLQAFPPHSFHRAVPWRSRFGTAFVSGASAFATASAQSSICTSAAQAGWAVARGISRTIHSLRHLLFSGETPAFHGVFSWSKRSTNILMGERFSFSLAGPDPLSRGRRSFRSVFYLVGRTEKRCRRQLSCCSRRAAAALAVAACAAVRGAMDPGRGVLRAAAGPPAAAARRVCSQTQAPSHHHGAPECGMTRRMNDEDRRSSRK